ncbi:MAG: PHP domain-containing protein [Candidatus Saelkia tenebricola]|nr:PHP domain-containing protein [Candidatus Saelkia tenebricola]
MDKTADLHVHTIYSDGTFSPLEVIDFAKKVDLSCVSITDHDAVGGIEEGISEGKKQNIEVIPGIELTVDYNNIEVHVLGYFIDYKNPEFLKRLKYLRNIRKKRFLQMVEKLKEFGINIEADTLINKNKVSSIGRLHLARELYQKGHVSSIKEAFARYIGDGKPCHVKKEPLTPNEAVSMINDLGGVSVLAHPLLLRNDDLVQELIAQGIEGIEVYHFDSSDSVKEKYLALAVKHNLVVTGGSDCHGKAKDNVLLGKTKMPYEVVDKLKKYRDEKLQR